MSRCRGSTATKVLIDPIGGSGVGFNVACSEEELSCKGGEEDGCETGEVYMGEC